MSTVIIQRPDITSEQIAETLRRELGSRYHVLPGIGLTDTRASSSRILVGTGSDRVFRAEITVSWHPQQTVARDFSGVEC